jgi:hypothetical protein
MTEPPAYVPDWFVSENGEPFDPDFALICDYLARALDPAEKLAVEERLATDIAFYRHVAPMLRGRLAWEVYHRSRENLPDAG